jgi:hypothetical protein
MTTGTPDYGQTATNTNEVSSTDVLELASRLNSPMMINRSGQLISSIADTITLFKYGWQIDGNGGYCQPSYKQTVFNRPTLKFITSTTSGDSDGVAYNITPFSGQQIGQAVYMIPWNFGYTLKMMFLIVQAGVGYNAGIQINLASGAFSYYNASGSWTSYGTAMIPNNSGEPFIVKYTFNTATGNYGYLWCGSELIMNLESLSFLNLGASTTDLALISAVGINNSAASNIFYIADHQITINEVV